MASPTFSDSSRIMNVVVVGGSISGLMHGIMLKSLGHNVRVIEQQASTRSDYGAGIGTGPHGKSFLELFDPTGEELTYDCPGFKFLGLNNETVALAPLPMHLSSWTAMYYRLRGLFDGLSSPFCVKPPTVPEHHGSATFDSKKRVFGVARAGEALVTVEYEDLGDDSGKVGTIHADLVIEAGGPYSKVRSLLVPKANTPQYAGFVAWRGTVPDTQVSEETNGLFDKHFNIFPMANGNYCIGYAVPGDNGSLEPGQRQLNWIWYTTMTDQSDLKIILTDREGHVHPNSVPRGKLDMSVWTERRDAILPSVNKAFAELMRVTKEPFVSTIRESFVTQRSFLGGRLLLVGDGCNLMRPNGGQATNSAAAQCLALRQVLQGQMTLKEWEASVVDQGWQMRLYSNMIGDRFLYGNFWAMVASLRLSLFLKWLRVKALAKRVFKL